MATPTTIMVIRHGEKPTVKHAPPFGVDINGNQDWYSLTVQGWQRAGALMKLFDPDGPCPTYLAVPGLIYASAFKGSGADAADDASGSNSKRPVETITPLAARLGIIPNLGFAKGDEKSLAEAVMQQSGVVLICWQHEAIHDIAHHLVKDAQTTSPIPPPPWPANRFDVVWVFTPPAPPSAVWGFQQVPQSLLAGDADTVIT